MNTKDNLGDRMKLYEGVEAHRRFLPLLPVMARLDGRSFSNFTRTLRRPFDEGFMRLMQNVTEHLMRETGAVAGYCQSDEISLCFYSGDLKSQIFFDGRIQKMTSTLAAMASTVFNVDMEDFLPVDVTSALLPTFDCRVWQVPTKFEAINTFIWRQGDCIKNAISQVAHHHFPPASLKGLSGKQMQEKLFQEREVNFNDVEWEYKRGTFFRKVRRERPFHIGEIEKLPAKHAAHMNPNLLVSRVDVVKEDIWLSKVENREEVIFSGAEPKYVK